MKLRQKILVALGVACLILSGLTLMQGRIETAAVGFFISACVLTNAFRVWPVNLVRGKKG